MDFYPFHTAIADRGENQELISSFLAPDSRELDRQNAAGLTPLHLAIRHGRRELAGKLLSRGVSRTVEDRCGFQALHHAAQAGDVDLITKLVRMGAEPEAETNSSLTPLIIAICNGHAQAVKVILKHLRRENDRSSIYGSDLMMGKASTFTPWICTLKFGESLDGMHVASQRGYTDIISTLCDNGADVNRATSASLLDSPLGWDDPEVVTSQGGVTPLHFTCQEGHLATASVLLERGANVNAITANGVSPLLLACERGHDAIVALLLRHKAIVNSMNGSQQPMQAALRTGKLDIICRLIKHGADYSVTDDKGNTVLHLACKHGRLDDVMALLQKLRRDDSTAGLDVNAINKQGSTAMHVATKEGHAAIVLTLINNRGDPNIKNKFGCTPVHLAVESDTSGLLKTLLNNGGDPRVTNNNDHTALDLACMAGDREKVDILLSFDRPIAQKKPAISRAQMRRGSHDSGIKMSLIHAGLTSTAFIAASSKKVRHSMVEFV